MIEEVGSVGVVQEKRRKERGKVVARERGRESAVGPWGAREKRREKHGVRGVFRGVAKLRVITARGSVSAVRVQSIKELRPARNCLGFILLGTGCGNACRKRIPFDPLRSPSPRGQ